jgi:hypothetical protein
MVGINVLYLLVKCKIGRFVILMRNLTRLRVSDNTCSGFVYIPKLAKNTFKCILVSYID